MDEKIGSEARVMSDHSKVFISYNHKDAKHLERLRIHLREYGRIGLVDIWDDTRLIGGEDWQQEIKKAIQSAKVAVLLISADFLASDFIAYEELPQLLAARKAEGTLILPVILGPCAFEDTELKEFQAVNSPSEPLSKMTAYQRESLWTKVANIIRDASIAPVVTVPLPNFNGQPGLLPEMVPIPAGSFMMGSTLLDTEYFKEQGWEWVKHYLKEHYKWEQPVHKVELPAFSLSRFPVTNWQYLEFIRSTNHPAPYHWIDNMYEPDTDNHPVVNASWFDAQEYCAWLSRKTGKRYLLPTEAEWEKAARGRDGYRWSWGNEWNSKRCNSKDYAAGHTLPVNHFSQESASPYGIMDCLGNVAEWCSTKWGSQWMSPTYRYPYSALDGRELKEGNELRVIRGGSFSSSIGDVRCASRSRFPPHQKLPSLSFRCVCEQ
jgi:toxoflavin biosynthesis protein ToxD